MAVLRLIPEVLKAQRHREVVVADGGDHGLEIVPVLARHADGFALNLRGDLEFGLANESGDLFGGDLLDALLDFDHLPRVSQGRNVRVLGLNVLKADLTLGQLGEHHLMERANAELVFGGEIDLVFVERDFRRGSFEVKPVGQLFFGLVDGVLQFHGTDLRNNVK